MAGVPLADDLRAELDRTPVRSIAEYLAETLRLDAGDVDLVFRFSAGSLRRTDWHRGPVRNHELEEDRAVAA